MIVELRLEQVSEGEEGYVMQWALFFTVDGERVGPLRSPARCVAGVGAEEPWSGGLGDPRIGPELGWDRPLWPETLEVGMEFGGELPPVTIADQPASVSKREYVVEDLEELSLEAFEGFAYRVSMRETTAQGDSEATLWVAPGIGLVRAEYARSSKPLEIELLEATDP